MNSRQFASLACKIIGVFIFIQGFILLSNVLYSVFSMPDQNDTFNIIMALITILFAILLYLFSNKLAIIMLKTEDSFNEVNAELKITIHNIHRVAFSVLGLFFMGISLPKLVSLLLNIFFLPNNINLVLASGGSIVQFILGLVIFLNSKKLVNFSNHENLN